MRGAWLVALVAGSLGARPVAAQTPHDPAASVTWPKGLALLAHAFLLDVGSGAFAGKGEAEGSRSFLYGVGNLWQLWPVAVGATAAGTVFDRRAPRIALEMTGGVLAAATAGEAVKRLLGRERPRTTEDPFRFHLGRGSGAFPSGHALTAFAIAGAVSAETESVWIRGGAFALALAVSGQRVASGAHWYSDVVAGAFLGHTIAYRTTRALRGDPPRRPGDPGPVQVGPVVLEDGVGLEVRAPLSALTSLF